MVIVCLPRNRNWRVVPRLVYFLQVKRVIVRLSSCFSPRTGSGKGSVGHGLGIGVGRCHPHHIVFRFFHIDEDSIFLLQPGKESIDDLIMNYISLLNIGRYFSLITTWQQFAKPEMRVENSHYLIIEFLFEEGFPLGFCRSFVLEDGEVVEDTPEVFVVAGLFGVLEECLHMPMIMLYLNYIEGITYFTQQRSQLNIV